MRDMANGKLAAVAVLALGLLTAGCSVAGDRRTPEPIHRVVERLGGDVEIRLYAPRVAVEAPMEGGRNRAFGLLFDYIAGSNGGGEKIAMTSPVATDEARRIEMTAPVATGQAADGAPAMRFFLPERFDAETAPQPTDPRLRVVALPETHVAVLRFSGLRTDYAVARARDRLEAALAQTGWRATGPAESWFYDPPWTLPPFRRNEVAIPVAPL
jgi:hypothetical protein